MKIADQHKLLLSQGQTGLSVAFDMPTLMGYDADHKIANGEIGHCGVSISSLEDMETLFDGIDLGKISVSMTINGPAPMMLAYFMNAAIDQECEKYIKWLGVDKKAFARGYTAKKFPKCGWEVL